MLRGFRWFALAAVVAIAALVGPAAALADNGCSGSATSIYSECQPTATGSSHPKKHHSTPATQPTTTIPYVPQTTVPQTVVPRVKHVKKHVRKHQTAPTKRVKHHRIRPVLASSPTKESSLGSAFDLGAGPTLLFALLVGTVLLLVGTGGVRTWRNRHRV